MPIKLEYLKQGHCPVCDELIPMPAVVNITLSNGTVMPQPVCEGHFEYMLTKKAQELLLRYCKMIWCQEILENEQRTDKEKQIEIKRIKALLVLGGE